MKLFPCLCFLAFLLNACDEPSALTSEEVPVIRYGTSFGECIGRCVTDLEVSSSMVYYSNYGWNNAVSAITKTMDFTSREYNDILSLIDQEKFLALEPVIGCPDCADGGAEWIEIKVAGRIKKVTFEYGVAIEGIDQAIDELRLLSRELKDL